MKYFKCCKRCNGYYRTTFRQSKICPKCFKPGVPKSRKEFMEEICTYVKG